MREEVEIPDRILEVVARAVYETELTEELSRTGCLEDDLPPQRAWSSLLEADRNPYTRLVWDVVVRGLSEVETWLRYRAWNEPFEEGESGARKRFVTRLGTVRAVADVLVPHYQAAIRRGTQARRRGRRTPRPAAPVAG